MKNKSSNSTKNLSKSKKKLLPPIKTAKKETSTIKITNKTHSKREPLKEVKHTPDSTIIKLPPSSRQDVSLDSSVKKQRSNSSLTGPSNSDQNTPPLNILEKQPTTLFNAKNGENTNGGFNPESAYQLDKRQRFEIYKRRLLIKPPAKDAQEAVEIINKTLDEIEDKYAPKKDDKFYALNSKKFGRMHPIPPDRIKVNVDTGKTEMLAVGLTIFINTNGAFEVWSVNRGNQMSKKLFFKTGQLKTTGQTINVNSNAIHNE